MSGRFPPLFVLLMFIVPIFVSACGDSQLEYNDVVPEGAGPEEVVRIWVRTMSEGNVREMRALFDPESPLFELSKSAAMPKVSFSALKLTTTPLDEQRTRVLASFDAHFESGADGDTRDVLGSGAQITLARDSDGAWRIIAIDAVGDP